MRELVSGRRLLTEVTAETIPDLIYECGYPILSFSISLSYSHFNISNKQYNFLELNPAP